jgi:hypothetical protein
MVTTSRDQENLLSNQPRKYPGLNTIDNYYQIKSNKQKMDCLQYFVLFLEFFHTKHFLFSFTPIL